MRKLTNFLICFLSYVIDFGKYLLLFSIFVTFFIVTMTVGIASGEPIAGSVVGMVVGYFSTIIPCLLVGFPFVVLPGLIKKELVRLQEKHCVQKTINGKCS